MIKKRAVRSLLPLVAHSSGVSPSVARVDALLQRQPAQQIDSIVRGSHVQERHARYKICISLKGAILHHTPHNVTSSLLGQPLDKAR